MGADAQCPRLEHAGEMIGSFERLVRAKKETNSGPRMVFRNELVRFVKGGFADNCLVIVGQMPMRRRQSRDSCERHGQHRARVGHVTPNAVLQLSL